MRLPLVDRDRLLTRWAELATARPRLTVGLGVALAVLAALYAAGSLGFKSDRSDLIDPDLPWQQRYAEFKARFPAWDDAIIVVERRDASDAGADLAFMAELGARLAADPGFDDFALWVDASGAPPGALLFEPTERVRAVVEDLGRARVAADAPSLGALLGVASLTGGVGDAGLAPLLERAAGAAADPGAPLLAPPEDPRRPIRTPSGRHALGFVSLDAASRAGAGVDAVHRPIADLRAHVRALLDGGAWSSRVEAGVTGIPVMESDETRQSMRDATLATSLSFGLIALLLWRVYRGPATPLVILASLVIGVAWSFGWVTLAVGHLQVLSVVFAVILLGLGVDSAIHVVARLELVHPDHDHMRPAIARVFRGVGAGILTGALTTAAAFAATAFTPFDGVAEMGVIAAGGVLLCTVSVMTCLPALLMVLPRPERRVRSRRGGEARPFAGRAGVFIDRRPVATLAVAGIAVVVAGLFATRVRYDPDLLALMPASSESVRWESRLAASDDRSSWHAVVVADDAEAARRVADDLRARPGVGEVGGAGEFFPPDAELERRRSLLASIPEPAPLRAPAGGVARLRAALERLAGAGGDAAPIAARLVAMDDGALANAEAAFARDRDALRARMASLRAAPAPDPDDLPRATRRLTRTADGGYVLRVYAPPGAPGVGALSGERLGPFVESVLEGAPGATGPAVQIYESTRLILGAYERAALSALVVIALILLWDFRSPADALCALIPVGVGAVLLLGAMGAAGVPLNFANTIVLPLIVGLGVDAGVHAVHRWTLQPRDAPAGLAGGTGRAVTLTTATTVLGFACMLLAEHRGVRSLGFVMSVGLVMVWAATVFVLPGVLRLRSRGEPTR